MLVKYANFVKIEAIAPDKRVRPKASNLLVILIEPLSLKIIQVSISNSFCHKVNFIGTARAKRALLSPY